MRIYLKNNHDKFNPIRFETTEPYRLFEGCRPKKKRRRKKKNNKKMSSDMGLVLDPKSDSRRPQYAIVFLENLDIQTVN